MENPGSIIQGIYRDRLFDASKQPKFDSGWKSNTIMASFHVLLARFIVHDPDLFQYPKGCLIMRLGAGSQEWDTESGPPAVQPGEETFPPYANFLLKEDEEDQVLVWAYLNNQHNEQGKIPSPLVRITATIKPKKPLDKVCPLREFALYLRLQGLSSDPQDFIINHVRHPLISKAPDDTLIRQIQFTF